MKTFGQTKSGTHAYMAPESVYGGFYSSKSDIYGFGILAWEMWHRKKVGNVGISEEIRWDPKPDSTHRNLFRYLARCRAYDPDERPTLQDILHSIENIDSGFVYL